MITSGGEDVVALIMVREHRDRTYEVRLALYRSNGALLREEAYSGIRSVNIDAGIDITKIGYGELYLISRGEIMVSIDRDKRIISIASKRGAHTE